MLATNQSYHEGKTETLVILNVNISGAAEPFHSERAAWEEYGAVEALDNDHFVLVVRPGGARRLSREQR